MADNGPIEAAKITLLLLKMADNGAVLAAKRTWLLKMVLFLLSEMAGYATAAAAKKGIAPVQIGAVVG
jgi:hypothetical protein